MRKIALATLLIFIPLSFSGCVVVDKTKALWHKLDVHVIGKPKQHTVIVPGYGAPVAGNTTYEGYIQDVANFVQDTNNKVNAVVFTGSYSSLKDTSEADSMKSYFEHITNAAALESRGIKIYTEQCAIVSWQNITYSKSLLTTAGITPDTLTVFGDVNREEKLKTFATVAFNKDIDVPDSAKQLLTQGIDYTHVDFVGYHFGDSAQSEDQRNALFAIEIAGAYNAEIGNDILKQRIDSWTTTFGYDVAQNLVDKGCAQYAGFR